MPELPEVEIVVRNLRPRLIGQTIKAVSVRRLRVIAPTTEQDLSRKLTGARFVSVTRRAKYLVFKLQHGKTAITLLGHLGMSGDMYVAPQSEPEPKHGAIVLSLGKHKFIYEDTRYFGRFTLDSTPLDYLGPEPLGKHFKLDEFARALRRSSQAIKVKLLDQCLIAGIGNIYASEALFRACIDPRTPARKLTDAQIARLWRAIPKVLNHAIRFGATRG
jgi:formamidopyrimidine-DNA glycosylase